GPEPEIAVQSMSDVVTVQDVHPVAATMELQLHCARQRALARARQSGQPDRHAPMTLCTLPVRSRDVPVVPVDLTRLRGSVRCAHLPASSTFLFLCTQKAPACAAAGRGGITYEPGEPNDACARAHPHLPPRGGGYTRNSTYTRR